MSLQLVDHRKFSNLLIYTRGAASAAAPYAVVTQAVCNLHPIVHLMFPVQSSCSEQQTAVVRWNIAFSCVWQLYAVVASCCLPDTAEMHHLDSCSLLYQADWAASCTIPAAFATALSAAFCATLS
ncbi:TPA: hypothetical protein ACH3X1_007030 [Trebouxia sp. C0004]